MHFIFLCLLFVLLLPTHTHSQTRTHKTHIWHHTLQGTGSQWPPLMPIRCRGRGPNHLWSERCGVMSASRRCPHAHRTGRETRSCFLRIEALRSGLFYGDELTSVCRLSSAGETGVNDGWGPSAAPVNHTNEPNS